MQLRLFDGLQGDARWSRDLKVRDVADLRLLGAGGLVGVLVDDEFQGLSPGDGALLSRLPVPEGAAEAVQQVQAGSAVLVRVAGTLTALDPASGSPLWSTAALGVPAPLEQAEGASTGLPVPEPDGFVLRDPATGGELGRSAASGLPEGGAAAVIGDAVVYRLPDRVLVLR